MNNITGGQVPQHKHHNVLAMVVFVLVAVIVTILLLFLIGWIEFNPPGDYVQSPNHSFEEEVDNVETGNMDEEFMELNASIESL